MKFKRLLTAGLMALFCAGTALAASQLNAVRVLPHGNAATVSLQTTGSFAHKEYRPEEHMLLVDLTGVTSNPSLVRTVLFRSPVLKSYALSNYTSAAGTEVTRLALMLGDNVSAEVHDSGSGLQIVLSGGGPAPSSVASTSPAAAPPTAMAESTPATSAEAASTKAPVPTPATKSETKSETKSAAKSAAKSASATSTVAKAAKPGVAARSAETHPLEHAKEERGTAPTVIRSVSVRHESSSLDVVVDGPSDAHAYLLKNPDRLVVDFRNAVMRPASKNISVDTKDVREVRVGRFQSEPPVTRVVADLGGPHHFDVVPSAGQVVVRIKTEEPPAATPAVKPAAQPTAPSESKPVSSAAKSKPAAAMVNAKPSAEGARETSSTSAAADERQSEKASEQAAASMASAIAPSEMSPVAPQSPTVAPQMAATVPQAVKHATELAQATPQPTQAGVELDNAATRFQEAPEAQPKYTGEPISVNLKDVDLKDFFRLIHEISGLNVVLDPAVHGTVTLVLDDVPWDQALDIVLKNNDLDRELHGNVLRIATRETLRKEAVERRAQAEALALAVDRKTITRNLSYAKATQTVPTIKKFLTARGDVIADDRTNTLIISDIPSVLPNIDKLIKELDQKTKEVEIEVRVVSATRSFSRDIGFQLGFNVGNGVTALGGSNPNGSTITNTVAPGSTTTTGGTGPITTLNPVPLFSNFAATGATTGLSFSNITNSYGIDAILTAAETHNLAKVLSRPRVVTQSNQKAEVKQGVKIPVYTSGTANANSTVTYVDAVLRLSVTPQITNENTIFLTVDVENTQPSGQLNGNYILTTQQATTQVLVSDGATVVIGGVIQTTNTVSKSQTPLLGDIPFLGNLFKDRAVRTESDELIFFITPRIIRT